MVLTDPGITFFCDQLGCNAAEFDDILLYDAAVTGEHAAHAAAAATVAELPAPDIVIGLPTEMFVNYNIPESVLLNPLLNPVADEKQPDGLVAFRRLHQHGEHQLLL